jgi:polyisoprenyl-phosphate glycosyltransferase
MNSTSHGPRPRGNPDLLSLIIPCCNEEATIPTLRSRLAAVRERLEVQVEIILVDDGSSDRTLELLLAWAGQDPQVRVLGLARNFGQQVAVTAGLDHACGDAVVIMDADLQDPPEVIIDMLAEYRRGFDIVYGQRTDREGETRFKRCTAWLFYRLMRLLIHPRLPADAGDFRLISKACLRALQGMRETHRFLRGMVAWTGLPQTAVPYRRAARVGGRTKYPLARMLSLAWTAAIGFSPAPLRVSFLAGIAMTSVGLAYGVYAVLRLLLGLYVVPGWTSVIVLLCLIGGSIQMTLGILGEYLARIYEEVKQRPLYIVGTTANLHAPSALPEIRT